MLLFDMVDLLFHILQVISKKIMLKSNQLSVDTIINKSTMAK